VSYKSSFTPSNPAKTPTVDATILVALISHFNSDSHPLSIILSSLSKQDAQKRPRKQLACAAYSHDDHFDTVAFPTVPSISI